MLLLTPLGCAHSARVCRESRPQLRAGCRSVAQPPSDAWVAAAHTTRRGVALGARHPARGAVIPPPRPGALPPPPPRAVFRVTAPTHRELCPAQRSCVVVSAVASSAGQLPLRPRRVGGGSRPSRAALRAPAPPARCCRSAPCAAGGCLPSPRGHQGSSLVPALGGARVLRTVASLPPTCLPPPPPVPFPTDARAVTPAGTATTAVPAASPPCHGRHAGGRCHCRLRRLTWMWATLLAAEAAAGSPVAVRPRVVAAAAGGGAAARAPAAAGRRTSRRAS